MVASGAKPFEQFFAEALLDPGDGVLVFSPQFPTYVPNLERRVRGPCWPRSRSRTSFGRRPRTSSSSSPPTRKPRAIFLNSPHNPTGGVATRDDLAAIADVVRGTELMVFSDEPYCHMVWERRHASILAEPGMLEHTVAAYTFSKSYSMSGWRIGFAVAAPDGRRCDRQADQHDRLVQPAVRPAGRRRRPWSTTPTTRDDYMERFRRKVERLCDGLEQDRRLPGRPAGGHVLRLPRRPRRSATGWGSPRTAWPCTCSKGPTTSSASPAWGANASARPARASSGSVAPSPTSGSTRPWRFLPTAIDRARPRASASSSGIRTTCSQQPYIADGL